MDPRRTPEAVAEAAAYRWVSEDCPSWRFFHHDPRWRAAVINALADSDRTTRPPTESAINLHLTHPADFPLPSLSAACDNPEDSWLLCRVAYSHAVRNGTWSNWHQNIAIYHEQQLLWDRRGDHIHNMRHLRMHCRNERHVTIDLHADPDGPAVTDCVLGWPAGCGWAWATTGELLAVGVHGDHAPIARFSSGDIAQIPVAPGLPIWLVQQLTERLERSDTDLSAHADLQLVSSDSNHIISWFLDDPSLDRFVAICQAANNTSCGDILFAAAHAFDPADIAARLTPNDLSAFPRSATRTFIELLAQLLNLSGLNVSTTILHDDPSTPLLPSLTAGDLIASIV